MQQKLRSNIIFADKLWQAFHAVVTSAVDELKAVLGDAVGLVMETIDMHIKYGLCEFCDLALGRYNLKHCKSNRYGCFMGKNKPRNFIMLILNIVVGVSLSANTTDTLAASVISKEQNQYHANVYIREKVPNNSGDLWERIRLGMKITSPSPTQSPSKQNLIPEKNNRTNTYSLHSELPSASATVNRREAILTENTRPEQAVKSKYIIQPHTAIAPLHNYTALGLRLRSATPRSSTSDSCIPPVSDQTQQEQTLKSENNSTVNTESSIPRGFYPQLHKRAVLAPSAEGILQTESEMTDSLDKVTNSHMPCIERTAQHLTGISKSGKQSDIAEKNNAKKAMINERINKYITLFSQSPGYLHQVAERARPYLYHIVDGLSKNQLPLELALLPMVESAYQPTALSPKGAAGLWQFIPSTGKDYNLKQSNQYDDRLDILASTQAAIRFLSDLKEHFNGDWLLALAAYNCGQSAIDKAISRNLSDGLDTDYWSLRLPEETQDYVPRLLALSNIFANPAIYGLKVAPIKNEPYFVKVKIDREVDIKYLADKNFALLARLVNLSPEQFKLLNPGYLNPTLSTKGKYTFLLPLANANHLNQLLTSIAHFMAEPVSQAMKGGKANSPTIIDLKEPILTSIRL
ncbi:MAG: transglycosylase SLT domain-containing protein [Methylobacter sp.]|nr:transglycosylase SLT domain-containing protein [Methylobacter sp.]